jgi:hypothetical protein
VSVIEVKIYKIMQFPHSHVEMKLGKEQACKKGGGV